MSLPRPSSSLSDVKHTNAKLSSAPDFTYFQRSIVHHPNNNKVEESDEELFMVPDVEAEAEGDVALLFHSDNNGKNNSNINNDQSQIDSGKRRRGRNPVDKEYRRLKRLLRNRVSAQQARERKKMYVNDLEERAKELQDYNSELEEKISTLLNENTMLRKVLMNTRPKTDESEDHCTKP